MCLFPIITLLAGVKLRAEDTWMGFRNNVRASASHNDSRQKLRRFRIIRHGQRARAMRPLDRCTAEYTSERDGQAVTTRSTVSSEGKELMEIIVHLSQ
jgi:hypothetical protein